VRRTQRGGVSSAKAPLRRGADDWLFMMRDGSRVVSFSAVSIGLLLKRTP